MQRSDARREVIDAEQRNGLHVVLEVSGAVRYDPRDMPALFRRRSAP